MSEREMDALTLTVIWNGIMSIAEELGITLRHTAFSEGVREGDDFSTSIFGGHFFKEISLIWTILGLGKPGLF